MEAPRTHQEARHNADRGVRELYRYYQPAAQADVIPSWLPTGDEFPFLAPSGNTITPPVSESLESNSTITSQPATSSVGSDSLILGTSNSTLTSFAQLAALRLNVERVLIAVLDRDRQHIVAEATQTINLNDPSIHDQKQDLWLGTPDTRKSWSICKVSQLNSTRHPTPRHRSSEAIHTSLSIRFF